MLLKTINLIINYLQALNDYFYLILLKYKKLKRLINLMDIKN